MCNMICSNEVSRVFSPGKPMDTVTDIDGDGINEKFAIDSYQVCKVEWKKLFDDEICEAADVPDDVKIMNCTVTEERRIIFSSGKKPSEIELKNGDGEPLKIGQSVKVAGAGVLFGFGIIESFNDFKDFIISRARKGEQDIGIALSISVRMDTGEEIDADLNLLTPTDD